MSAHVAHHIQIIGDAVLGGQGRETCARKVRLTYKLHCDLATVVAEHGGASDQQHEAADRHGEAHRRGARLQSAYAMPEKLPGLPP